MNGDLNDNNRNWLCAVTFKSHITQNNKVTLFLFVLLI